MKYRSISTHSRADYHRHIVELLHRDFEVVARRDDHTTLRRKTRFNAVTFFLSALCVGIGAAFYVGYWAFARAHDETVTVELTTLN